MAWNPETTLRSRFLKTVAGMALALAACAGLAGCGGGGSGGGGQVMIVPDPSRGSPDLVVESSSVSDPAPAAGADFALSARVRNAGEGSAAAATLRFYRSGDAAIAASDEEVGDAAVAVPASSGSIVASVELSAPRTPGTYYYGACVGAAPGESDAANNCSPPAQVTVPGPQPSAAQAQAQQPPAQPQPTAVQAEVPQPPAAEAPQPPEQQPQPSAKGQPQSPEQQPAQLPAEPQPPAAAESQSGEEEAEQAQETPSLVQQVPRQLLPQPDLVVESPAASNADLNTGAGFRLSATVRNAGDGAAAATTARFYRSADASITTSDAEEGSRALAGLAASGSVAASLGLTAPQAPGTYYYGVCADAVAGESDTANNCSASVRVTVVRPPDLVVGSPSADNANPLAGARIRIETSVRNAGGRGVGGATVRFYRSADATITKSDTEVSTRDMWWWWLAPSFANLVWQYLTTPSSPGTYYYGACVDGVANESDTTNNCSAAKRITVREASPPDLVVASPSAYPAAPAAQGLFALGVKVRNTGGKAGGVRLRYYRSDDAAFTAADAQVGTYSVGEMPTNSSESISKTLDTPGTSGTYYYRACADAVAGESDTTNNCSAALKVEVTRAKPNLQIKEWGLSLPRDGSSFGINAVVRNIGGPSPATTLRFYHSTDRTITTGDTELTSEAVPALRRSRSQTVPKFRSSFVSVTPPATGTHYYGACVDAVTDESDATDNCALIRTLLR